MVIKIQFQRILFIVLVGITSCRTTTANNQKTPVITADPLNTANIQSNLESITVAGKPKIEVDIYETKYVLCDSYCLEKPEKGRKSDTIITWGKPTEIGFMYAEQLYPRFMTLNPRKKILYNGMTIANLSAELVIKSRGLIPPLRKPLATAKFTPFYSTIPMYFPKGVNAPLMTEAKANVRAGNIKIVSVKKLSSTEADFYIKKANNPPNLATMGAMEESVYKEIQTLAAYYEFYKDKPEIKPQQVETISEQVNVTPQVIQIKKW